MLHYDIHEDASVVEKSRKTGAKDIWEAVSAVLFSLAGTVLMSGLCAMLVRL